ncbi:MAG: C10 family peptidase [Bacteroidales bacterium]|nr:C10 family peptidase [Bacteroidales bacterium]
MGKRRYFAAGLSLIPLFLIGVFMILSCSEKTEILNTEFTTDLLTKVGALKSNADLEDDYYVTSTMVEELVKQWEGKTGSYAIEAFPSDESPAFYVVNFEKGWKMFPADSRFGVVLAENPEEYLDMSRISENVGRDLWFSSIQEHIEHFRGKEMEDYDKQSVSFWNSFRSTLSEKSNHLSSSDIRKSNPQRGLWAVVEVGRSAADSIIFDRGSLINTDWGQGYPWNIKMPNVGDVYCQVGCPAVAVSQVLRYFNVWAMTTPSGLYHSLTKTSQTFNSTYNGYQITLTRSDYNYCSPRWSLMPLSNTGGTMSEYGYASDLMLDIGVRLGTYYNIGSSGVPQLTANFFNLYPAHLSFSWAPYTSSLVDTVVTNLTNRKPVIMTATRSSDSANHTWIISGYQRKAFFTRVEYQLWPAHLIPPDSVVVNVYNESELASIFPNYYAGMSFTGRDNEIEAVLYFMNWGLDGAHKYDLYFAEPVNSWEGYNTTKAIHYNLSPWELIL